MSDDDSEETPEQRVKRNCLNLCQKYIAFLLPDATQKDSKELNWDLLVDLKQQQGQQRLDSQYVRCNTEPSERYVLSVAGSTDYRLEPGKSGFTNLYLAGDWTKNGFNAGCIEATVMSGKLASNAMCGYPPLKEIIGLEHP